jgi:TRAP-type C4-dicarboxylate transport system permease small subunit
MRKLMLGVAMVACVAVGGCATVNSNGTITLTATGQTVVNDIKTACNVAADLTAITTLIGTFPAGTAAAAIAAAFCQTVNAVPLSAKLKATPATPNAVRINGVIVPYTKLGARLKATPTAVVINGVVVPYTRR